MARNRDKRPGTNPDQQRNAQAKTGDTKAGSNQPAGSKTDSSPPVVANRALAAKIEPSPASEASASKSGPASSSKATSASSGAAPGASSTTSSTPAITATSKANVPGGGNAASASTTSSAKSAQPKTTSAPAAVTTAAAGRQGHGASSSGGGGFWSGVIGGVIGGAAVALAASYYWINANSTTNLETPIASLEDRMTAAEARVEDFGSAFEPRLTALEGAPPPDETSSAGTNEAVDTLSAKLAEVETQLAALTSEEGSPAGTNEATDALSAKLTEVETQLAALTSDVDAAKQVQQSSGEALVMVQEQLPTLEGTIADAGEQTAALTASLNTVRTAADTLGGDLDTLSTRVGEAEERLDHIGGAYQRGAAMIVAIGDVDRAITRSEPFESAIEALRLLLRDDTKLDNPLTVLEPMAASGVPSLASLKNSFGPMASRVLLAEEGDPSLTDQVSDNVFGLFNIRPAGVEEAVGPDSRAVLARTQAKLSSDDLKAAVDELGGLETPAIEAAGDWLASARDRLTAEAAVIELRAHAQTLVAKGS